MLQKKDQVWVEDAAGRIRAKMEWVSEKSKDKIPYTTINGIHDNRADRTREWNMDDGINWWTNGFWGGIMWLMYHETGDKKYADIAVHSEDLLDQCFEDYYGLHHDVGFMWLLTAVANYRLTKNPDSRKRGLHAASLLASRFNPVGRFIRAWNDSADPNVDTRGWAIIDCMLNIPLLYWASEETNDPRFKHIAMQHADTSSKAFIRPDGSSNHIVEFDPDEGGIVRTYGGQGYENGSSWTRGQAWALYGFVMSYIHTGKQEYLDTAKRVAHYFIDNIPENGIIPVDFRQPKVPKWEDSTAAAIAACGLIEISRLVNKEYHRSVHDIHEGGLENDLYLDAATKLLRTLGEKRCDWSDECDCILQNCTASYHSDEHHFPIIYGDYFFIEAIFKLKENDIFLW